jgi:hypothetical protein
MSRRIRRAEKRRLRAEGKKKRFAQVNASGSPQRNPDTTVPRRKREAKTSPGKWLVGHAKILLTWVGVVASIAGGYIILRPNLTIEPDFFLNGREPFSAFFRVQNNGTLAVYDLSFSCDFTGGPFTNIGTTGSAGQLPEQVLPSGASVTKDCGVKGFAFDGPANLTFTATFRPALWPWHRAKRDRFGAVQDSKRFFHWTHRPLENPK